MTAHRTFSLFLVIGLLLSSCGDTQKRSPVQAGPTPAPTLTPIPAPDVTVCASDCDFTLIQQAIEAGSTQAGTIIGVIDLVHTEAGIRVSKNVVIQGQGAGMTIVQAHPNPGEGTQRVFEVLPGVTITLRGMTIRHGNPRNSPLTGGGIQNNGVLVLEDVIVRDNYSSAGGGIYNDGMLTLINSAVQSNGSDGRGDSYLECSTGGGIKVYTGTTTLINSTVSDNRSRGKGGGIHVACSGTLVLQNSTISGNFTSESGGGVFLNGVGNFTNSTISNNSAYNSGGISIEGSGEKNLIRGQLSLANTIIADNIGRLEKYGVADCHMDQHATIIINTNNWIGDGTCDPAFSGDPLLGPLTDNGGSTLTHGLLPDSPAIDVIPAESCSLDTDQRGQPRLAPCDIGAFEVQTP